MLGMPRFFQNPGNARSDAEVYQEELRLAELAEPLGFDSVWSIEHHFTDYTMCPDAVQFLSYMAGKTKNMKLGTMVIVLPWHDPVRVAEQIALLDHLSDGRMILGFGRGLARVEYEGFRIDQNEGRNRFVEYAELVINGLKNGYVEGGLETQQPRREIRPYPKYSFEGRTYAAAVSPESMPIMAKLGIGLLVIPQKPWEVVQQDFEVYHKVWREEYGAEAKPPQPLCGGFFYVDEDAQRAEENAYKWIGALLPHRHAPLRNDRQALRLAQGLRVLQQRRQVHQQARHGRRGQGLRQADAVGHPGPGAAQDREHARHDRPERHHVQHELRRHALRRGRAQPPVLCHPRPCPNSRSGTPPRWSRPSR